MSDEILLTGIPCLQNGKLLISGSVRAKDLVEVYEVDEWKLGKPIEEQGCQRPAIKSHYQRIGRKMKNDKRLVLPTSIVLGANDIYHNEQERDRHSVIIEHDTKLNLITIRVPKGQKIRLVDGQHRTRGADYAISQLSAEELDFFYFPFVLLVNFSRVEEIRAFYEINTTGKKVDTNLALQLLNEWDRNTHSNLSRGEYSKVVGLNIAMQLNEDKNSVWYQTIHMSGKSKNTFLTATSFVRSLIPFLSQISFIQKDFDQTNNKQLVIDKVSKLLNNYWNAIQRAIPEAFPKDPSERTKWYIQKNVGARVWHMVAPFIIEECMVKREKITSITEDAIYEFIIRNCSYGVKDFDVVWSSLGDQNESQEVSEAGRATSTKMYGEIAKAIISDIEEAYVGRSAAVTY